MKIVYLGSGEFGIECLDALSFSEHDVRFIVTQPPNPAGRGRKPHPTQVAYWAEMHSIPFIETDDVNASDIVKKIAGYEPDLIVVIAFGQKIGAELANLPPKGSINVHSSLLPKYRGAAPINWAIINGETKTGISIIAVAQKMDAGHVLAQVQTDIAADETAGRLHDRLAKIAAPLLLDTIAQIANGTAVYIEQDHDKATCAPKLRKSDGFLDFAEPAEILARKIRGFWPWPGAAANYISKRTSKSIRVTIAGAQVVEATLCGCPGQAHGPAPTEPILISPGTFDENLNIICGQACPERSRGNALKITRIKPAGSELMDFKDFVNGRQTRPGDFFSSLGSRGTGHV
ncbi:MAG: methionyl-tRNA formyltransferase [Planctomycetes bacterium RBG_13_50_24]|nr:MAG: methionyl-tRNA formyltransferase [Planctomycetes bacterium RBG_13_50_24]